MIDVELLRATKRPVELISEAAGCCYGKNTFSKNRVITCFKNDHLSVFEHVSITFRISGISRACSHQLVRHRVASYSQKSQRYTKLTYENLKDKDWYVTPPDIVKNNVANNHYDNTMYSCLLEYLRSMDEGVKPEDARFMLPEATKTEIVVSMNLREFYHFLDVRYSNRSQWEIYRLSLHLIRSLENDVEEMYDEEDAKQWRFLMNIWRDKYAERVVNGKQ